jgi:hypothetical protein
MLPHAPNQRHAETQHRFTARSHTTDPKSQINATLIQPARSKVLKDVTLRTDTRPIQRTTKHVIVPIDQTDPSQPNQLKRLHVESTNKLMRDQLDHLRQYQRSSHEVFPEFKRHPQDRSEDRTCACHLTTSVYKRPLGATPKAIRIHLGADVLYPTKDTRSNKGLGAYVQARLLS